MITKTKDSFYLERLKTKFADQGGYWHVGDVNTSLWKPHSRTKFDVLTQQKLVNITFDEQTYGGFQLVIIGIHYEFRKVFDLTGNTISDFVADKIGGYSKEFDTFSYYQSMAYEIDNGCVPNPIINWIGQYATMYMYGGSCDKNKTIKSSLKKLDLLSLIKDVKNDLISMCDERLSLNEGKTPYNVNVGDHIFIQAHGRLRKGIIVQTVGSRFIVGYTTPSNPTDLKYKTLRLNNLRVK